MRIKKVIGLILNVFFVVEVMAKPFQKKWVILLSGASHLFGHGEVPRVAHDDTALQGQAVNLNWCE